MTELNHKNKTYRIYSRAEYMPIRREVQEAGFRPVMANDGSLAGTEVLKAYLKAVDANGSAFETVWVCK